jgi:pyridoxine kinase
MDTSSLANARKAIDAIHAQGPKVVLVTSFRDGISPMIQGTPPKGERLEMLASDGTTLYRISTPELPFETGMAGSGDLTASVFLSRYLETKDIKQTLELTTASVYGIMEATFKAQSKELRIVQAQQELVSPTTLFKASSS